MVEGEVEQWVEESRQFLSVGDAVFIPAETVHASFVAADAPRAAHPVVVLGPGYGDAGYETVDVASEPPVGGSAVVVGRATFCDARDLAGRRRATQPEGGKTWRRTTRIQPRLRLS